MAMARTQLFISYAHVDNPWRLRVMSHLGVLARARLIEIWDDRKLAAGDDWRARINDGMSRARIALLLISASFLDSDFITKREVPRLFRRHEADGMTIYPLLIRTCSWEEVRWLKKLQIRPEDGKAVSDFRGNNIDRILTEVAREIARMARGASKKSGKSAAKKSGKRPTKKSTTGKSKRIRPGAGRKASARTTRKAKAGRSMKKAQTRVSAKGRMSGLKSGRQRVSKRTKPK